MTPSPFSRLASATVTGLVSIAAQVFAGAKTFTSAIIASAGVQLASLWNTNGTSASDVGVKVGVSTADGSMNAAAKLASFLTGIGGTEVESLAVLKGGRLAGGLGYVNLTTANGAVLGYSANSSLTIGLGIAFATTGSMAFNVADWAWNTSGGVDIYNSRTRSFRSNQGANAGEVCIKSGTSIANGSVSPTAYLHQFITGSGGTEVVKAQVSTSGEWEQLIAGTGVVLKSPDGTRWRLTISNAGAVVVAAA